MKAGSVGLEAEVHLSAKQIFDLRDSPIEGFLRFRDVYDREVKRMIPLRLQLDIKQKEFLEVEITPERVYFGDADEIVYTINDYLYERLVKTGSCGDRYWNSGKLIIFRNDELIVF